MSCVDGGQDGQAGTGETLGKQQGASYLGRVNLRAFMDVAFGGAALAMLLVWLVLAIAGGRPS